MFYITFIPVCIVYLHTVFLHPQLDFWYYTFKWYNNVFEVFFICMDIILHSFMLCHNGINSLIDWIKMSCLFLSYDKTDHINEMLILYTGCLSVRSSVDLPICLLKDLHIIYTAFNLIDYFVKFVKFSFW